MNKLTTEQQTELADLIQQGKAHYSGLARVVNEIYTKKLFAEVGTIDQLCKAEFGISHTRTYQLIEFAEIVGQVESQSTIVDSSELKESHTRELAKVPDDKTIEVLEAAKKTADAEELPLTAKLIRTTAAEFLQKSEQTEPEPEQEPQATEPKPGEADAQRFRTQRKLATNYFSSGVRALDDLNHIRAFADHSEIVADALEIVKRLEALN